MREAMFCQIITEMFHAPPFLFILTLTLVHSPFFHAIPVNEEQRHQTIHRTIHSDPLRSPQPDGHQEAPPLARSQHDESEATQERATPEVHSPSSSDDGDELFKDISPKALAAVLLQALNTEEEQAPSTLAEKTSPEGQEPIKEQADNEEDDGLIEKVRSRTQSSDKDEELRDDEKMDEGENMENVKSLLQELEGFEPPPKREQNTAQDNSPESKDLQELRELLGFGEQTEEEKRSPLNPVPHTPRRWEEEGEGEEEEEEEEEGENLANVAQDLLLQYLMSVGKNEAEKEEEVEEEKENGQDYTGDDFPVGQRPLFEDEEEGNIQDKRSTEDDEDEVDPQTIDKLIELSSRLHLPADDVVDIINDVEKRKRRRMKKKKARDDLPGRKERTRTPPQSWSDFPNSAYYPRRRLEQEPTWNKVPETSWEKISAPNWYKNKMSGPTWNKAPGSNWNKASGSNWNKVSGSNWNKAPESNWNKASGPNWNKVSWPNWNKMSGPNWNKVSGPNWNKVSEPSWNKVSEPSWNTVSGPNWNKVSEPSWNKVSEPSWNKVSEPSWNKKSDQSWNKVSEPSWNKKSDQSWNKVLEPSWNKVSEPSWNKKSDQSWNKVSEPSWSKVSEPNWNKMSDQSWNKKSDQSWNKVSEPSWNSLPDTTWNKVQEPTWNKVARSNWNKVLEPTPRRYRTRPDPFTNYIRPRAFQNPPRYYYKSPVPQRDDYFDEDQDKQEEMENYIESILLTHPEVFQ
ncbi:neurosecretory protein VGF isoform X2 [Mixophyes fleayi]|uniref:neurosecretory protein VGF isoform X2 n=1 Tax=Mixophyes fleayi TaxID=3061075 RepID=UPI003F4DB4A0